MEKTEATTTVSSVVSSEESHDVKPISKWSPGYKERFPYTGAIALICIAILACAGLGVLIGSDGVSTTQWPQRIAPNVVLSAINALSSMALAIAVAEGVAIAWWRQAMKGSTVKQLHHQWELSGGIAALFTKPKSLFTSSIALAVLATQVTLLNSILYQRSTSTYTASDPPKTLGSVGIAAQEFPATGYVVSNVSDGVRADGMSFMMGDNFIPVVNNWQTANGFFRDYNELFRFGEVTGSDYSSKLKYCDGICFGTIETIGFEIDCEESQQNEDIAIAALDAYKNNGNSTAWTDIPIFNSTFGLEYSSGSRNYTQITIDLQFFQSDDAYNPTSTSCPGTVFTKQCSLRPAIISYPYKIKNFTNDHIINGVELMTYSTQADADEHGLNEEVLPPKYSSTLKQAEGFSVVSYLYPNDTQTTRSVTALGGITNAISQFLASTAAITYMGDDNSWSLGLEGTLAGRMMFGPPNMGSCDCSFRGDSLDIIIADINQLTFLTATGMINTSSFRGLPKGKQSFPSALPEASINAVETNYTTSFVASTAQSTQLTDVVHYRTHYVFAGIAFGITLLCIGFVIPSFWHYGELGRTVTLGPVEIASAFGAPILVDNTVDKDTEEARNENINTLIKHIGDRKIVYGFVDVDEGGRDAGRQEMRIDGGHSTAAEVVSPQPTTTSSTSPKSPDIVVRSAASSPMVGSTEVVGQTSGILKRRSVRLEMGAPERVRPTSQLFPTAKSPRVG